MSSDTKNKVNWLYHVGTGIFIILLAGIDLITKGLVFTMHPTGIRLTPIINTWAAWSLAVSVPVIIGATLIVCVWLVYVYYAKLIQRRAFILLLAGGLGNVYDRLIFHGVRDRIHIGFFPVFNIADILITLGVLLIALEYKRKSRAHR